MGQLNYDITIQSPESNQYVDIARLHIESITTGFLSTLGIRVLKEIYEGIDKSKYGGILVATHRGEVVGYISYTESIINLYKDVLLEKGLILSVLLVSSVIKFSVIKKIFETIVYPFNKLSQNRIEIKQNNDRPELLSIAIHDTMRGLGIGKKLISVLNERLKEKLIYEYYVVTLCDDINSNKFYQSCGFEKLKLFVHHKNQMVEYMKRIDKG